MSVRKLITGNLCYTDLATTDAAALERKVDGLITFETAERNIFAARREMERREED